MGSWFCPYSTIPSSSTSWLTYARPTDSSGSDARGAQEVEPGSSVPYPANPNGSVADIAGVCDPTGRVLGLMPHPERNLTPWNHPRWTRLPPREEGEGLSFYRRMVEVAAGGPKVPFSATAGTS